MMDSSLRRCTQCNTEKPTDEFPRNGTTRNGKPRWRSNCNSCQKTKISEIRANKAFWADSALNEIEDLSQEIRTHVNNPDRLLELSERLAQLARDRKVEMSATSRNSFIIDACKVILPAGFTRDGASGYIKQKVISSYYENIGSMCNYNDVFILIRTKSYCVVIVNADLNETQKQSIMMSI